MIEFEIEIECEEVDRGKFVPFLCAQREWESARGREKRAVVRGEFLVDLCIFCPVLDWQGWRRIRPCVWA